MEKNKNLVIALEDFKKAFENLNEAWISSNEEISEKYPFERSFGDYDVENWVKQSLKNLKR